MRGEGEVNNHSVTRGLFWLLRVLMSHKRRRQQGNHSAFRRQQTWHQRIYKRGSKAFNVSK